MSESRAWLLSLEADVQTAVGHVEIAHFLEQPRFFEIPGTPFYCNRVTIWEQRLLPVMDLTAWLQGKPVERVHSFVAVGAYQTGPAAPLQYGGLLLASMPEQITVSDEQACQLPAAPPTWRGWQTVSISCFARDEKPVPILDLSYIFSAALRRS